MRLIIIALLVVVALDQLSKHVIYTNMLMGQSLPVFPEIFHITYIQNPGAAFGLMANQTLFFIIVTVIVIAGIVFGHRYLPVQHLPVRLALGLIAGGATGNLVDRLRIGKVIDFLDFRVWPVFNLADTAIVVGSFLLVWYVWKTGEGEKKVGSDAEE